MQPTRLDLCMMIAAQRPHRAPPILSKRRREPAADVRIARTAEVNEPDLAEKARRKLSSASRVTSNIPPCRIAVIGNGRRPPSLRASSHDDSGWVAPALAMMRSTGSKERFAPSALLTVICGHGISAARAFSARPGSISIAVIFPICPTSSAATAV